MKKLTTKRISEFQKAICDYYKKEKRIFPWRKTRDPYRIIVSEIMLQQTQTDRVVPKYLQFLESFPTLEALAHASVPDVLRNWQGLGYNRRALFLKRLAETIIADYGGKIPSERNALEKLPGIGKYTAGAIRVFAFRKSDVFIETNIRRVFIHFFFKKKKAIHDKDIMELVNQTVDEGRPHEWYWALMDYGSMLGKTSTNANTQSKHYAKQSKFHGSDRQLRGNILRMLLGGSMDLKTLLEELQVDEQRLARILQQLEKEGFVAKKNNMYHV